MVILSIRNLMVPRGTFTSAISPTFLLSNPCAIGVLMEILFCFKLASLSLTMVYFIFEPVPILVISTVERICMASLLKREVSTIFACAMVSFISLIFDSRCDCASFAASYSEFSLKSPLSAASAIAADAFWTFYRFQSF